MHEQEPHVAEGYETSEAPELVDFQPEMEHVDLQLEMEPADHHVELGQVNSMENQLVQQLEQYKSCSWVCLGTESGIQMGVKTGTGAEEQAQEPDHNNDGDGDDGDDGGDGDDDQPAVEEQD